MKGVLKLAVGAVLAVLSGCRSDSPTAPDAGDRGLLILSFSDRCPNTTRATIFIDRQAAGLVLIPGAISVPIAPGTHTYSAGSSPTISFEMPPNGRVILTNSPVPCP